RGFVRLATAWVVKEDLPFTAPESDLLALMFRYSGSKFKLPSDTTIRNTLTKLHDDLHGELIAYSNDSWTTRQMVYSFSGSFAHYITDEWKLVERLIDFHHISDKEHEGV
ncbi:hypothetical protein SCHPADRAFT_812869, partial [Schizopora paradoxa]